eukprot:TRINITY_DN606_c0_g1_i1.p1 TRINITY_DN606_c0_g1~~TRINITY_DN606_c0_g1_i1.p1  ORF type:complete len:277 (+),score=109.77 TRINITY_DN606_c0_g1_i1:92-922(+)
MAQELTLQSKVPLNQNNVQMPVLAFGVYLCPGQECVDSVGAALRAGYRHIDTAAAYGNEEFVGEAIRNSGLARDEIFLCTKLWNTDQGYESTLAAFETSCNKLGTNPDLYILHYPVPGKRLESYRALETLYREGKVKAIGVSNFCLPHLRELLQHCTIKPAVNQLEVSAYYTQTELVEFCQQQGIAVTAYSPLTKGQKLNDPKLVEVANKYGKSTAQILIRYCLQRNMYPIVKSSTEARIIENADVFNWSISDEDMQVLNSFNEDLVTGWDPRVEP